MIHYIALLYYYTSLNNLTIETIKKVILFDDKITFLLTLISLLVLTLFQILQLQLLLMHLQQYS